jgi:prevent-host-death family protein
MYDQDMDVAISELRANLRACVAEARGGRDVVITERGVPVARLVAVDAEGVLERLEREGILRRPVAASRPVASGRRRVRATGPVSDLVAEHRR